MNRQKLFLEQLPIDAFRRDDDHDDSKFYEKDRLVEHLDALALSTVEHIIETLVVEQTPRILDLMAGYNSHLPNTLTPHEVVGLGLNENELKANESLDTFVIHDLNKNPTLPFENGSFDVVLNVVSVDYLIHPLEVFQEVGRILKPDGLFLVIFSNRMFPPKAIKLWKESSEEERVLLVKDYFAATELFKNVEFFVSKGKPRPQDDKYAVMNIPSDPIYALFAEKKSPGKPRTKRPRIILPELIMPDKKTIARKKEHVHHTLTCPYCDEKLKKWAVPQNPYTEWDNEFMYICFNDLCSYFLKGFESMQRQGNFGLSYRFMFNPENRSFSPVPVPSETALRESIIE